MRIEELVLTNLVHNENYVRKVIPFLEDEYFSNKSDKTLFRLINGHFQRYNTIPSNEAIEITLHSITGINEHVFNEILSTLEVIKNGQSEKDLEWLVNTTEKFCRDKAIFNAIAESVNIIDGNNKTFSVDHIPELLSKALSIGFDTNIGHDYFENASERYDIYKEISKTIPFDIDILNKISRGGMHGKALYLLLGGTGGKKTLSKCHIAGSTIRQGFNVLYITLEMSEARISERIDANLLDIDINNLPELDKELYLTKLNKLQHKNYGKLIVKEYPAKSITSSHIKYLIEELDVKRGFRPDLLIVDYLGLLASTTYKNAGNVNSYTYNGAVATELRALGQHFDIPVLSSVQTNRAGLSNSDPELENVADSHGISTVADMFLALYSSEEMQKMDQMMIKVLKNRFNAPDYYKRFLVGVTGCKMRLYNLDQPMLNNATNDTKSDFGNMSDKNKPSFDGWS